MSKTPCRVWIRLNDDRDCFELTCECFKTTALLGKEWTHQTRESAVKGLKCNLGPPPYVADVHPVRGWYLSPVNDIEDKPFHHLPPPPPCA
jgi:hypothetical protein